MNEHRMVGISLAEAHARLDAVPTRHLVEQLLKLGEALANDAQREALREVNMGRAVPPPDPVVDLDLLILNAGARLARLYADALELRARVATLEGLLAAKAGG